ncbi:hypothetical protein KI387_024087, partial [Taxus chinensis]
MVEETSKEELANKLKEWAAKLNIKKTPLLTKPSSEVEAQEQVEQTSFVPETNPEMKDEDQKSTRSEFSIHIGSISSEEFESPQVEKLVVEEQELVPNLPGEKHVQVEEGILSSVQGNSNECSDPNCHACQEIVEFLECCIIPPKSLPHTITSHEELQVVSKYHTGLGVSYESLEVSNPSPSSSLQKSDFLDGFDLSNFMFENEDYH